MESAKASVKKIIGRDGKHDTTVHESVAPAVTNENVTQTEHEKTITAVDREVHQDHYHTTQQPVLDKQVMPETHHHTEMAAETREFDHSNNENLQRSLDTERSQFRDSSTRVEGEKTKSTEPVVAGEHVHHHVHETIQPVVNREVVEPHVVHKTVPIHEVHHNEAQHHSAHQLPPVSMDEFKNQGGALKGREERKDFFEGQPQSFPGEGGSTTKTVGSTGNSSGNTHLTGTSYPGNATGTQGVSGHDGSTPVSKPSMGDKMNPKIDADGDGKAGFMS